MPRVDDPDKWECARCSTVKPKSEFHKNSANKSGINGVCKSCKRSYDKEYYKKHKDKKLRQMKEWREEYGEEYRERNREHLRKQCRKYYWQNPEKHRAKQRRWAKNNREKVREIEERRRAREEGCDINDFDEYEWQFLLDWFNHHCAYCNEYHEDLEKDHIKPYARGGNHTMANIVPACRSCNSSKSDSPLIIYIRDRWDART